MDGRELDAVLSENVDKDWLRDAEVVVPDPDRPVRVVFRDPIPPDLLTEDLNPLDA